ncbi:hypothetical protein SERLA73DRAFT_150325 [Serpula lacrymans var. lacrymans S7.3]|uniref:Uncharacterized protein n=1 Tax=Serpula lacrymans var. lacrymans (strain S7.3) TaxID=936435 RepID=F8PM33_SERL3|nr:hypothetical protein SERLA73DRAFT_150325 [Serpula lacrymans var. lacrymans S7.3]
MHKLKYSIHIWKSSGVQVLYNRDVYLMMPGIKSEKIWGNMYGLYSHSGNKEPGNKVVGHRKYVGLNQVLNTVKKKELKKRMWDLYRLLKVPRAAEMKGRKVVKNFQMQASRDLGMLSFVLSADRDTNGAICMSFHEQNDKATFELFSKVQPNWQNIKIWEAWGKYA